MSWFADLAGKAENLLNNLDEQTGVAIRNHSVKNPKKPEKTPYSLHYDGNNLGQRNRRSLLRNSKKTMSVTETKSSLSPPRKLSPSPMSRSQIKDNSHIERNGFRSMKSPQRIKVPQYNLHNCPKTLVHDVQGDSEVMDHNGGFIQRRHSLPTDDELSENESVILFRMQNLEVENAMLKNELNVINKEVSQMVERLKIAEEGNFVDRLEDVKNAHIQLENAELENHKLSLDRNSLSSQLELLKSKIKEIARLEQTYQDEKQSILTEKSLLNDANNYLEERVKELNKKIEDNVATQRKLEAEARHAQSTITDLQINLDKANEECQRLEKDWEAYKLRVKSMLFAKDKEIKALQDGLNLSEDTKVLVEQIDSLKEERDELSEAVSKVRTECDAMKQYLSQVENRHSAAERVVVALRDAIREERAARNKAETQVFAFSKELKNIQIETGQTIASLRTALRDKEAELNHIREAASCVKTNDSSALNVADYDVSNDAIDNDKIHYLTETLVQKQAKVDKLLAENNVLKIQMDKLESKLQKELSHRPQNTHSVVNLHSGDNSRARRVTSDSLLTLISHRMAAVIRRHPVLRVFVVIYMICLHFWVLTVLLTSTPPPNILPRSSRS